VKVNNAMTASDKVIVIVSPGYFELDSIVQISKTIKEVRNVSMILRHFFRKNTVEAFPPPVAPACVLLGRQAY
jgi:cellulose biosynthesis protein BcsQ